MTSRDATDAAARAVPAPVGETALQPAQETWREAPVVPSPSDLQPMSRAKTAPIQVTTPPGTPPHFPPPPQMSQVVNVTTHVGGPTIVLAPQRTGPNFLVRALWFVFLGSWLSAFLIVAGYLAMITIIGIPLAFFLFNRLPQVQTLRPRTQTWNVEVQNGVTVIRQRTIEQRPWWARALYFLGVGWWLGAIWLVLAWALSILILPLPLSILMIDRAPGVMTLQRH